MSRNTCKTVCAPYRRSSMWLHQNRIVASVGCAMRIALKTSSLRLLQKQLRIHHSAVQCHAPVQMRTGDAAGSADGAEHVAGFDLLAGLHRDFVHVAVHGNEAAAVVEENGVAVEIKISAIDHK